MGGAKIFAIGSSRKCYKVRGRRHVQITLARLFLGASLAFHLDASAHAQVLQGGVSTSVAPPMGGNQSPPAGAPGGNDSDGLSCPAARAQATPMSDQDTARYGPPVHITVQQMVADMRASNEALYIRCGVDVCHPNGAVCWLNRNYLASNPGAYNPYNSPSTQFRAEKPSLDTRTPTNCQPGADDPSKNPTCQKYAEGKPLEGNATGNTLKGGVTEKAPPSGLFGEFDIMDRLKNPVKVTVTGFNVNKISNKEYIELNRFKNPEVAGLIVTHKAGSNNLLITGAKFVDGYNASYGQGILADLHIESLPSQ